MILLSLLYISWREAICLEQRISLMLCISILCTCITRQSLFDVHSYLAIIHDSIGGGRVATATDARSLFSPENNYCTNVSYCVV